MAHVIKPNVAPYTNVAGGQSWNFVWLMGLLMIKAGWRHKASSGTGTKVISNDPMVNRWGVPVSTGNTGTGAQITVKTGYDVTITGLAGMEVPTLTNQGGSEGRFLVLSACQNAGNNQTFQIVQVVTASVVLARPVVSEAAAVAPDVGLSPNINWTEYDPATVVPVASFPNNQSWIVLRGPSMLRMVFSGFTPTPDFLRGEKITQAATGAEGEMVGITYDPLTGNGWAIVAPRVSGTGGGARGWGVGAGAILGSSSGASLVVSSCVEHVTEITFGTTNTTLANRQRGTLVLWINPGVALDGSTEQAMLASTLASTAACTANVMPGASGSFPGTTLANNGFPYLAFGGVAIPTTANSDMWNHCTASDSNTHVPGNMHAVVANCMERADVSADGTFWAAFALPSTSLGTYGGWGFFRCDDSEEGDVWPFVWYRPARNILDANWWAGSFRTGITQTTPVADGAWCSLSLCQLATRCSGMSWRARGLEVGGAQTTGGSTDLYMPVTGSLQITSMEGGQIAGASSFISSEYTTDPEKVASAATATLLREHPLFYTAYPARKFRKGRPRWLAIAQGNQANDTFGTRAWVQFRDMAVNSPSYIPIILGPWDAATTPLSQ